MKKNIRQRSIIFIVLTLICFLPFEIWLGIRCLLEPVGFWQELVTVWIGWIIFGFTQIIGFVIWVVFSIGLWSGD